MAISEAVDRAAVLIFTLPALIPLMKNLFLFAPLYLLSHVGQIPDPKIVEVS